MIASQARIGRARTGGETAESRSEAVRNRLGQQFFCDALDIKICLKGATLTSPGQSEAPPWAWAGLRIAP